MWAPRQGTRLNPKARWWHSHTRRTGKYASSIFLGMRGKGGDRNRATECGGDGCSPSGPRALPACLALASPPRGLPAPRALQGGPSSSPPLLPAARFLCVQSPLLPCELCEGEHVFSAMRLPLIEQNESRTTHQAPGGHTLDKSLAS